jgi:hypothetical protein
MAACLGGLSDCGGSVFGDSRVFCPARQLHSQKMKLATNIQPRHKGNRPISGEIVGLVASILAVCHFELHAEADKGQRGDEEWRAPFSIRVLRDYMSGSAGNDMIGWLGRMKCVDSPELICRKGSKYGALQSD